MVKITQEQREEAEVAQIRAALRGTGLGQYTLDENGEAVPAEDIRQWARDFGKMNRVLAKTQVGTQEVSTVFLALDHDHSGNPQHVDCPRCLAMMIEQELHHGC